MKKLLLVASFAGTLTACGPNIACNFEKGYCKDTKAEQLENRVNNNEAELTRLLALINSLTSSLSSVSANIDQIEDQVREAQGRIVELEANTSITEIIDPCGDDPGELDEVIFKLTDGSLVALFIQGQKSFLTLIEDGNYQTTDKQKCNFSVSNGEYVE